MKERALTMLPIYNEVRYVNAVLDEVRRYSDDVLVVDDGSTDGTGRLLAERRDITVRTHSVNRGYGAALRTGFDYALAGDYSVLVTIDCDGQHEPRRIPNFVAACCDADMVSGSRYLKQFQGDSEPPRERRHINQLITAELNALLGLKLTDAFCGFKAYRVSALRKFDLREPGYGMPLELWVQAAHHKMTIVELPVPLIYLDEERSFGGALDQSETRMRYYRTVLERSLAAVRAASEAAAGRFDTESS